MFQLNEFLKNQASGYWLVFCYCYGFFLNTGLILTYELIYPVLALFNYLGFFCSYFFFGSTFNYEHQILSHVQTIIFLYRKLVLWQLCTHLVIYKRQWYSSAIKKLSISLLHSIFCNIRCMFAIPSGMRDDVSLESLQVSHCIKWTWEMVKLFDSI